MEDRCVVILEPVSKRVNVAIGSTVYDALLALNYPIGAFCGGAGTCGKCKIRIEDLDARVSEPNDQEINTLDRKSVV